MEAKLSRRRLLQLGAVAGGGSLLGPWRAARASAAESIPTDPRPLFGLATVLDQLVVSVGATGPAEVMARAWPDGRPEAAIQTGWVPTNPAHTALLPIPGTGGPEVAWRWQGFVRRPGATGPGLASAVRSVPNRPAPGTPSSFTFAFGSCMTADGRAPTLAVARSFSPLFFAMLGDMGYMDNPKLYPDVQNYAGYVGMFKRFLNHPDLGPMLAEMPFYGMQDDHDYGFDNCYGTQVKSYAAQAYADLVPGAGWPTPSHRRWSVGGVDFFLTDNRRFRDPPKGPYQNGKYPSNLGNTQRDWLFAGLERSTARVKVVFAPMTVNWYWSAGEKAALLSHLRQKVTGTVLLLTGDKHAGAFVRYEDRIWELLAGPLKNSKKHLTPLNPNVVWTENGDGRPFSNAVGVVHVDTLSASPSVTLRLLAENGAELHQRVLPV